MKWGLLVTTLLRAEQNHASAVVDLSRHNANASCIQCGFNFGKNAGMPVYEYTTSVTSAHNAYMRTQERTTSIRAAGLRPTDLKILGMKAIRFEELLETHSCSKFAFR